MRQPLVLLFAILWLAPLGGARAVRYMAPPQGSLVFNQVLDVPATEAALRLPKIGRYYAELIVESAQGDAPPQRSAASTVDLGFSFMRRTHRLLERNVTLALAPDERFKTVLWFDAPDMLPERTTLDMRVAVRTTGLDPAAGERLRLQITRKLEPGPLHLR